MVTRRPESESEVESERTDFGDVTESDSVSQEQLRALRAELKETGGRILSSSAHGIRNHLTIIQSYLEIIHSDLTTGLSDEQLQFLGIAHDHVLHLRSLIDDLVLIGAIETGIADLRPTTFDIGRIATRICAEGHDQAQRQNVTLRCEVENDVAACDVDVDSFHDLTRRLVDNSLKFTPRGGAVVIRVFSEPPWTTMSISDTGAGIPAESLDEVFELFSQFHRVPGEPKESHGLGLPIVRRLVEASGGEIAVDSTVGGGTVVTVRIPSTGQPNSSD